MTQSLHFGEHSNSIPSGSMLIIILLIKVNTRSEMKINCHDGKGIKICQYLVTLGARASLTLSNLRISPSPTTMIFFKTLRQFVCLYQRKKGSESTYQSS